MKAIVVIDLPESCDKCPCYYKDFFVCRVAKKENENWYGTKPNWCPLKPMPNRDRRRNRMKTMFEVEIAKENHSWYRFVFKFETLEEAQQFVKIAMTHFYKDEDDEDMINCVILKSFPQKKKEKKNESNTCD